MVCAEDAPLEMCPETFYGVGGNTSLGILAESVTYDAVTVALILQVGVSTELVGEYMTVISHELLDDRHQRHNPGIGNHQRTGFTVPGNHTEDRSLGLGAAPLGSKSPPGFVLVGLTTTEVHFIDLHLTFQCNIIVLPVKSTNLMQNVPRGLLGDVYVTCQLARGYALLVGRYEVHRNEPLAERYLSVLEDSAHQYRKISFATRAVESAVGTTDAMVLTAERANNVLLVPPGVEDSLAALIFGVEVVGEVKDIVEALEVNHKSQVLRFLFIYTLNLGFSFTKIYSFCIIFQEFTLVLWTTGI